MLVCLVFPLFFGSPNAVFIINTMEFAFSICVFCVFCVFCVSAETARPAPGPGEIPGKAGYLTAPVLAGPPKARAQIDRGPEGGACLRKHKKHKKHKSELHKCLSLQ